MIKTILLGVLSIAILGCSGPSPNEESDKINIMAAAKAFSQAYVDGDLETQMEFYTKDAVILPGARNMIEGIDAVTKYWDIPKDIKVLSHKSTSTRLEIEGNMASDYGYYEGQSVRNNDTTSFRGQYVIVWKKGNDGKWRMAIDMWSALRDNN